MKKFRPAPPYRLFVFIKNNNKNFGVCRCTSGFPGKGYELIAQFKNEEGCKKFKKKNEFYIKSAITRVANYAENDESSSSS